MADGRPPSLPPHLASTLPAEVTALLAEMLQIDPENRPGTADVHARLQRLAAMHATAGGVPMAPAAEPAARAAATLKQPIVPARLKVGRTKTRGCFYGSIVYW